MNRSVRSAWLIRKRGDCDLPQRARVRGRHRGYRVADFERREEMKKVKLKLVGLDGNAYSILSAFRRTALNQGWTEAAIKRVLDEAMSGDYNHMLSTIMRHCE